VQDSNLRAPGGDFAEFLIFLTAYSKLTRRIVVQSTVDSLLLGWLQVRCFGILPLLRWSFDKLCVRSTPAEASLLTTQTRCGLRRSHVFLSSPYTAHILHCQNVIRKLKKKLAECCEFDPYVHFNKSRMNPLSICLFACREEALDLSSPPPDLQRDLLRQMVKAKHQGV